MGAPAGFNLKRQFSRYTPNERAAAGLTGRRSSSFMRGSIRISPTLGTRTGYAAAIAEANGPEAGLAVLDAIELDAVSGYQPYWAVRAHLLQRLRENL